MSPDAAEELAIKALGWLASSDDLFPVFMGATGASAAEIRDRATDPEFLVSVIDFLMMDDQWIIAFCDASGYRYEAPQQARTALPGGAHVNWT